MKNIIYIENLEIFAFHGVIKEENELGQKFIFNIECELDYKKAMINDNLQESVSYADIVKEIYEVVTGKKYKLLEKLSYEIIKKIFLKYNLITKIRLKINKPNAPIPQIFSKCGTFLEISRKEFEEI